MNLVQGLHQLKATNADGFEGLVAKLLERLTGQYFRLAKPGSQLGRDMSSNSPVANVIAVECKRYGKDTALIEKELLGQIDQAYRTMQGLDLWVLVSTRSVDSTLYESLKQSTEDKHIGFVCIADNDTNPSTIAVLCAQAPDITLEYLGQILSNDNLKIVEAELGVITSLPGYSNQVDILRQKLTAPTIGHASWCSAQNKWFTAQVESEETSRASFGQILNAGDPEAHYVCRTSLLGALNAWYQDWPQTKQTIVVTGEEGDGKTWGVAAWLQDMITDDQSFPAVVFVPSFDVMSSEPLRLIAEIVSSQLHSATALSTKRLERWLKRNDSEPPRMILVLDGINQHRDDKMWRQLLERIVPESTEWSIATIITCRTQHWSRHFGQLDYLNNREYVLPPFDDVELQDALSDRDLVISEIHPSLHAYIRKPRYLDLVAKHRDELASAGEFTIAKLMYFDWRDRYNRKVDHTLADSDFQKLLCDLAKKTRGVAASLHLNQADAVAALSPYVKEEHLLSTLDEMISSGILIAGRTQYDVDEYRLCIGLGLLLVDSLQNAYTGNEDLDEAAAEWLEPQAGMDIKSKICEMAALNALPDESLPIPVKSKLLQLWLCSQNPDPNVETTAVEYVPMSPDSYIAVCNDIWAEGQENRWAQEVLLRGFLRWYEVSRVADALHNAANNWLSIIHVDGFPTQHNGDEEKIAQIRIKMSERVGYELTVGSFGYADRQFTVVDDIGILRLGRFALALISHLPLKPFIRSIANCVVAEEVMGYPDRSDLFRWVMSTSEEDTWTEIQSEAMHLIGIGERTTDRAAYRLLSYQGSTTALDLRTQLADDLFPKHQLQIDFEADPCHGFFAWTKEQCEECIRDSELSPQFIARRLKPFAINPTLDLPADLGDRLSGIIDTIDTKSIWTKLVTTEESLSYDEFEPALCRVLAHELVTFVRAVVNTIATREPLARRQLSFLLKEQGLIFTQQEIDSVLTTWQQMQESGAFSQDNAETAEFIMFIEVLAHADAESQLDLLMSRHEDNSDLVTYKKEFLPISDWSKIQALFDVDISEHALCRILWFLSAHPERIPLEIIERYVARLVESPNSCIRSVALEILYLVNAVDASELAVKTWRYNRDEMEKKLEGHWGSLVLCKYGSDLSFSELCRRIDPLYIGYAVVSRGNQSDEIRQYAHLLDTVWRMNIGKARENSPDIPEFSMTESLVASDAHGSRRYISPEFDRDRSIHFVSPNQSWGGVIESSFAGIEEALRFPDDSYYERRSAAVTAEIAGQVNQGNYWFGSNFSTDGLSQVVIEYPEYLDSWLSTMNEDDTSWARLSYSNASFLEALCIVLLEIDPDNGVELYRKLSRSPFGYGTVKLQHTGFRKIDLALFAQQPNGQIDGQWKFMIESATNDNELLQLAVFLQSARHTDWLLEYCEQLIGTATPISLSRGIAILGFVDTLDSRDKLSDLHSTMPDTWLRTLVDTSLYRYRTNEWARHWYTRYFAVDEVEEAWAAFRLFLRCVDSRYWIWNETVHSEVGEIPQYQRRNRFVNRNLGEIEKAVNGNEKELKKTLFGQKAILRQCWPWMGLPRIVEPADQL